MKLHVISNPNNPTGPDNRTDYFSYDCYKFIKYLSAHFDIIHYGIPGAQVSCKHFDMPVKQANFNRRANQLIKGNKSAGDVILCFYGYDNYGATIGHSDCFIIEPHIGYKTSAVFAPYRVFTSYAQMHYYYGQKNMLLKPSWYDAVIPNAITISEFDFKEDKSDYVLFLGRVVDEKGINIAIQATEKAGKQLIIAGSPDNLDHLGYQSVPDHVQLVGHVDPCQRKELLSNALCLIAPTYYLEPFGLMIAEAHASGTPTITTDWGAFPEINPEGVTGYRCRMFSEFVWALNNIENIDRSVCRQMSYRYSDHSVYPQFKNYIENVVRQNYYA